MGSGWRVSGCAGADRWDSLLSWPITFLNTVVRNVWSYRDVKSRFQAMAWECLELALEFQVVLAVSELVPRERRCRMEGQEKEGLPEVE